MKVGLGDGKSDMKRTALMTVVLSTLAIAFVWRMPVAASTSSVGTIPSRSFLFSFVIHVPALPAGDHQLRLWVPLPYEERYQGISKLKIESPVSYHIYRESEYGNRYAYLLVDAAHARTPFDIRVSFHVQRFEHRVSMTSPNDSQGVPTVSTTRFLQPDHLVPIDGVIATVSADQTQGAALPLDKAHRIYEYVVASMHYDHDGTGWGQGDAVWACGSKHGDCTDFHSLFIGMARAAGFPARFEIGFPLPDGAHESTISSYHCWAQFYVQGIGWIPIDASEAWKNKEKREFFFGATDQNRVMFSLGRDIRLNPPQAGDPLNYFVYPYAELDGKPFADLKNEYSFRDDSVPPAAKGTKTGSD
jgi:transglutaminase-like putative cysteine protease